MAYRATNLNLSSGQIHFNDPTKPWDPSHYPILPSTNLVLTAHGRIEDRNVSTLTLTNAIQYAPYESQSVRPSLEKSLLIANNGVISYKEATVGVVSTTVNAFSKGTSAFNQANVGGAGIQDAVSGAPDSITNAIGKLDSWIANAFLYQPPAINAIESETNAFYGGVRWQNFDVYNVMDKSVPFVNSILFVIGNPSSTNYVSFEVLKSDYFPYKNYKNGISPVNHPVVRLRIFTDFFPNNFDVSYSRQSMQFGCIRVISESGFCTFPATGKVIGIDYTDGETSYTTINVYLPNISSSYPKDTSVPVSVVYLNQTVGSTNVANLSTVQSIGGAPSAVQFVSTFAQTPSTIAYRVERPVYSDMEHSMTVPYFSTYKFNYKLMKMNAAHNQGFGYRYGINDSNIIPAEFQPYTSNLNGDIIYQMSTQNVIFGGNMLSTILPAAVWSTSVAAVNSSHNIGDITAISHVSTLFARPYISSISSVSIVNLSRNIVSKTSGRIKTLSYNSLWTIGNNPLSDVLYFSTPLMMNYRLSAPIQFNDPSYPGDRSTIAITNRYIDDMSVENSATLTFSTFNNDFPLNSSLMFTNDSNIISTVIQETFGSVPYQKYFYKTTAGGAVKVNNIADVDQSVQMLLTNSKITGFDNPVETQTFSTPVYNFRTEPYNKAAIIDIQSAGLPSATAISGLYTPVKNSPFNFNIIAKNTANVYSASNFGYSALYLDPFVVSGSNIMSTISIRDTTYNPITSLPIPQNSNIILSSFTAAITSNVYQDPIDAKTFSLIANIPPANPFDGNQVFVKTITPTIFIDTVSQNTVDNFINPSAAYGQRVLSLMPRLEVPGTQTNIQDGVDASGNYGSGLDVAISSFYSIGSTFNVSISTFVNYNHTSSISSIYTDPYNRELIYTNGHYMHVRGLNFSQFNANYLQIPDASYPDFTTDGMSDDNFGYRYATFAFTSPILQPAQTYEFIKITLNNASAVGTIVTNDPSVILRSGNDYFPDGPVASNYIQYMKCRMHVRLLGSHNPDTYATFTTGWIDCWKNVEQATFDDNIFGIGGAVSAQINGQNITYTVQINKRAYTKILALVRIGIARDGSIYGGSPLMFDSVGVSYQ